MVALATVLASMALAPPLSHAPLANVFSTEKGGLRLAWALVGSDSIEMELTLNGTARRANRTRFSCPARARCVCTPCASTV